MTTKFDTPIKVTDLDLAFGGNMYQLLPDYNDIPKEYKDHGNYWVKWQSKWFFNGLTKEDIPIPKEGIDINDAMNHLKAIQGSFETKHEHKESGVAYLASKWFLMPTGVRK